MAPTSSNFAFLRPERPEVYEAATRAEANVHADARTACFLIVEHLTRHGAMSPALLYEPPFTNRAPHGPKALFPAADVEQLVAAIDAANTRAAG